jgi:hypothetical protein
MATKSKGVNAYPLSWPKGVERARSRCSSAFSQKSVADAIKGLKLELSRLSARGVVISTNIPLRVDGDPYSSPGRLPDPGVAVYFQLDDQPYCMPCDRWQTVEENLWAITKNVEAMRGMQRWGVGSVSQSFAGFKALTAAAGEDWWDVLECTRLADKEMIERQYRARVRAAHPDTGGSHEAMARLNSARDSALAEVRS